MVVVGRPMRGARLAAFYPPIPAEGPSLSDLDSAFQLQEYIALLIRQNPHDVDAIVMSPGRVKSGKNDEKSELSPDKETRSDIIVDEACWIYEQLRRLAQDLTHPLITSLQQECTRASCPEMKAGEWLYLCVAHGNEGAMEQCCAIDYIIHTLDSATALLNSPRAFPSRISIPHPSIRHFSSLARRLGRIFAHAYFHHREAFESAEAESSLYARFLALTAQFELVPPEFLVIPPRMLNPDGQNAQGGDVEPPRLLGAALHPQPISPENPSPAVLESPRKLGRNRTDTMVFSDAEAFSEALRGQTGSPLGMVSSSVHVRDFGAHPSGLGLDSYEKEREGGDAGIPPVESLDLLAESDEACRLNPSEAESKQEKPYTLTFSASGTMKTTLPPGVSPSSSAAKNLASSPSASAAIQGVPQAGASEYRDAIEERAPTSEGDDESALDTVLSQEDEESPYEGPGDRPLVELLARKQVLDSRIQDLDLDEDDIAEWASRDHITAPLTRDEAAASVGEEPSRRQPSEGDDESEGGGFVVIEGHGDNEGTSAQMEKGTSSDSDSEGKQVSTNASGKESEPEPAVKTFEMDPKEVTTSGKDEKIVPSEGKGSSDEPAASSSASGAPSEETLSTTDEKPEQKADEPTKDSEDADPNTSLETDLADVEKTLSE